MLSGAITNVAIGSGLKIAGVVVGKLIEGHFRNKEQSLIAAADKEKASLIRLKTSQGGKDRADAWTKATRRVLALMFMATFCFVVIYCVTHYNQEVPFLIDKEHGVFAWIFGGTDQKAISVTFAQLVFPRIWTLAEILFGFYFTKIGDK